ncbi:DUF4012 domain-containing protein [Tardiphaga sp.]|uniref:DUF4012 domain-containing protein n=1 Tax=Tardiphaga sp. TaxID=1926292 RepID=UPI0037D9CEA1
MTRYAQRSSAQFAGRVTAWCFGFTLLLVAFVIFWVGIRGAFAYEHMSRIQGKAANLAGDVADGAPALDQLASDASEAHRLTSDPIWKIAELTPWIGQQLAAFATVSSSANQLLGRGLLPLAVAAKNTSIGSLKPIDGQIDVHALSDISEPAQEAARNAREAADAAQDIDRTPLLGVVNAAVEQATDAFSKSAEALDALSRTSILLPSMLGQDRQRAYLVLVQNNAEWRSLGGITGSTVLLTTHEGAISLTRSDSATSLSHALQGQLVDLPPAAKELYSTKPARYFHNLTQIPDFAIDGNLAREMYQKSTGIAVDGVIAVDPVALSYLLEATGPVEVPGGTTLTSSNAAEVLMNDVYLQFTDPGEQDAFFERTTGAIFQALLTGRGSVGALVAALSRAADEHRVYVWSADPSEQAVLAGTTLAGALPVSDTRTARFGVFLNDGTGSKMSYYVKPEVELSWDSCQRTGEPTSQQLALRVSLANAAPADADRRLPWYITGGGVYGVAPGTARVIGNLYLPKGYDLVSATASDGATFEVDEFDGYSVLTYGQDLAPQSSADVTVVVKGLSTAVDAEAFVTPTVDSALAPVIATSCETRSDPLGGSLR